MERTLITVQLYWQQTFVGEMTGFEEEVAQYAYEMMTEYECTSVRIKYIDANTWMYKE